MGESLNEYSLKAPEQVKPEGDDPQAGQHRLVAETQETSQITGKGSKDQSMYSLGIPESKLPDLGQVFRDDPEFEKRFHAMTGDSSHVESPLGGMIAPDSYRHEAFRQMIGKYGLERVKETFAALEKMGKSAGAYSWDLKPGMEATFAEQNKRLDALSSLMKPGKLEEAQAIDKALKEDGYTKKLSLSQINDTKLMSALKNPDERKAMIEFENAPMVLGFARARPNFGDRLPSENLVDYKEWKRGYDAAEKAKNKPLLDEIEKNGEDPAKHLSDNMRANRVLMIGEQHDPKSPLREFGASVMKDLKGAGATHLALECTQEQLDKFSRSGNLDELPEGLRSASYGKLIEAAKAEGLQVVGIDNGKGDENAKEAQERDNHMASRVKQILDGDTANKVVVWSGALHGADTTAGAYRSTADLLRQEKIPVATVMEQSVATPLDELTYLTGDLVQPTAISTKKAPEISKLEILRLGNDVTESYGLWDSVVIFPSKRK